MITLRNFELLEKLENMFLLYEKGETIERSAEISGSTLWDLIEEAHSKRISRPFDIEQEKSLFARVLGKDDPQLKEKILKI
jgi:hypothetical protein